MKPIKALAQAVRVDTARRGPDDSSGSSLPTDRRPAPDMRPTVDHDSGASSGEAAVRPGKGGGFAAAVGAEQFRFEIANSEVTAASRVGAERSGSLPSQFLERLQVVGDDVVFSRSGEHGLARIVFSDADDDGLYAITSRVSILVRGDADDSHPAHPRGPQLDVDLQAGGNAIVQVSRVLRNGETRVIDNEDIDFQMMQGLLVAMRQEEGKPDRWQVFRDGNADGIYTAVAEGVGELVDLALVISTTAPDVGIL